MSLNIQTPNGLLEIGGKVTKEKIISALEYTPANETHVEDANIHVSTEDRQVWDSKSTFSGNYNDLIDAPNIEENDSGDIIIADENGNIIMQVDKNGLTTTNVNANTVQLDDINNNSDNLVFIDESNNIIMRVDANGLETTYVTANAAIIDGINVGTRLNTIGSNLSTHTSNNNVHITSSERNSWNTGINTNTGNIAKLNSSLSSHTSDSTIHITNAERVLWNNKSNFSGDYNDLTNAPNIVEDESGNVVYADENGNIIVKIDENGLETTQVVADTVMIDDVNVGTTLSSHISNEVNPHNVTKSQVGLGNVDNTADIDKPVSTAQQNALDDLKNELSETIVSESDKWVIADEDGYVIAKIDENGLETTTVTANTVMIGEVNVGTTLSSHTEDADIHITSEERNAWDAKATTDYVDEKIADLVDSSPETLDTLNELAAALGDDPNFATTVAEQIGLKANEVDLSSHTSNKDNPHEVTATQIGLGNVNNTSDINKPVSTAQQAALDELRDELSEFIVSESDEWIIADENGNVIAKVDENGLETTTVTANKMLVNGTNIETRLNELNEDIVVLNADENTVGSVDKKIADAIMAENLSQYATDEDLDAHINDTVKHITADERIAWNAKANQTDLTSHVSNKSNPHDVTASQVGLGNVDNTADIDKPVSTAQQAALDNLKNELSETIVSESDEWIIADEDGNIVARIDENGLETTTVTADVVIVDGTNVKNTLNNKSDVDHKHTVEDITDLTATATELNYMDGVTSNVQGQINALTEVVNGKSDDDHTHTITANYSDDDVVILVGTDGTDSVTYSASHATSGVTAGTYKSVTVNEYGHITAGTNPTTLEGYGIIDAAKKADFEAHTSNTSNPHSVTAAQVGLGNVDNTADMDKPVSNAQQDALDDLKTELSESIVSESDEWTVVDENGNVILRVDDKGLETTTVTAQAVVVNNINVETKFGDQLLLIQAAQSLADTNKTNLDNHIEDSVAHITATERNTWNSYSTLKADKTELHSHDNKAVLDGITSELVSNWNAAKTHADSAHARVDATLVESSTTNGNIKINGVETNVYTLPSNISTTTYVDESIAALVNSAPEALNTLDELAAALGDDENFATTVTNKIAEKASKTELEDLKNELSESIVSESDEWIITDEDGYIIARIDKNGLETTTVTANSMIVNGIDIEAEFKDHSHSVEDITDLFTTAMVPEAEMEAAIDAIFG